MNFFEIFFEFFFDFFYFEICEENFLLSFPKSFLGLRTKMSQEQEQEQEQQELNPMYDHAASGW